ncbi:hypothetical protein Tco_1139285 [Tanacetum coccineum]
MVDETHKEDQQVAGGPPSLGITSEEGADPQLSSGIYAFIHTEPVYLASFIFHSESASRCDVLADFTTKVDPGKSAPYDSIPQQHDKTKSAGDELKTAHTNLNEPIIITDKSEEEEAKRYEDTHATSHDEPEDTSGPHPPSPKSLEQKKAEAEVAFLKAQPLYPNVNQLTELLLKKHVQDMEIKLPGDLKDVPNKLETYTSIVSSLTSQVAELKTLQWELTTEFATIVENASPKATDKSVPLAGQADASPAKDKGKEVIFSKDAKEEETKSDSEDDHANPADSMIETSKKNKLKKFSFVTEGGEHIHFTTKKIEEEKRIEESLKAELAKQEVKSDLHLAEWREVVQACPNKKEKGWKTIYGLIKTRMDYLNQTKKELKIDYNRPLKEQDPLNELNDLANKKRKRAGDFKDHSKSTKKHKSISFISEIVQFASLKKVQYQFSRYLEDQDHLYFSLGCRTEIKEGLSKSFTSTTKNRALCILFCCNPGESSSRSPSEFEEKTRYKLRRFSTSEERNNIRITELVSVDNSLLTP